MHRLGAAGLALCLTSLAACGSRAPAPPATSTSAPTAPALERPTRLPQHPLAPAQPAASGPAEPAAPPRFEAQGHQPRWQLRLDGQDQLSFEAADGLSFRTHTLFTPDASSGAAALGVEVNGHPALLSAERKLCRDAHSSQPHPWQVSVTYRGRVYLGCGGRPEALLMGVDWQMDALDGAPSLTPGRSHLRFEPNGRASGRAACNRFSLRYDTRDGGLSLGQAASTRMACAEAPLQAEEAALLAFLPQVARFDFDERGDLLLRAADGRRLRLSKH